MARKGSTVNGRAKNREASHSKPRDDSPSVVRFFKIMFGKNYSKVLYLPPLFAEKVKHLAGQETEIEDSDGTRWPVEYSFVDGSLAFQKGWSRFYTDHGLQIGYFVVFNYVNESHFVVQIYDESVMEITDFNSVGPQSNKRLKRNPEIICIDDQSPQSADANLREKSSSADSVASQSEFRDFQTQPNVKDGMISMGMDNPSQIVKVGLMSSSLDDPILMIDTRNKGCYDQGERKNILYDLSCFEMEKKMGDTNVFEKASGKKTEQIMLKGGDTQMAAIRLGKINNSHSGDISTNKLRAKPSNIGNLRKSTREVVSGSQNGNNKLRASGTEPLCVGRNKSAERDYAAKSKFPESSVSRSLPKSPLGPQHAVKKELVELRAEGNIFHEARYGKSPIIAKRDGDMFLPVVKASGIVPLSVGSNKSAERGYALRPRCAESSVSSLVPKRPLGLQLALKKELVELRAEDNLFPKGSYDKSSIIATEDGKLFLPVVKAEPDLPYDTVSLGAISPFSTKVERQLYLELPVHIPPAARRRDCRMGEGKVMFLRGPNGRLIPVLYPGLFKAKTLTGNWNLFCEKNGLKPGDECRFDVEDENRCLYRVGITRSNGC